MTTEAAALLSRMRSMTGPGRRSGGGTWFAHRKVVGRDNAGAAALNELRGLGLVESYGTDRNRHHALTEAGLTCQELK